MVAFLAMGPDDVTESALVAPRRRSRRMPQTVRVVSREGTVVCSRCEVAKRMIPRMRGLLGRDGLAPGEGMLLDPAPSIMTFFMRFPIDVVFVDKKQTIVKIAHSLKPWRVVSARRAVASVELPAGTALTYGLQVGDVLSFEPANADHPQ
jgi:uncharacterized membrane protein (UPF0127 family)